MHAITNILNPNNILHIIWLFIMYHHLIGLLDISCQIISTVHAILYQICD